jgi:hypothetical protein
MGSATTALPALDPPTHVDDKNDMHNILCQEYLVPGSRLLSTLKGTRTDTGFERVPCRAHAHWSANASFRAIVDGLSSCHGHHCIPCANLSNRNHSTSSPIAYPAVRANDSSVRISFDQLAEYAIPTQMVARNRAEICNIRSC